MNVDPGDELQSEPAPPANVIESIASEALEPAPNSIGRFGTSADHKQPGIRCQARLCVGQRIGPYEITAEIGEGAIGIVYRATLVDEHSEQFAVTVIKHCFNSDVLLQRFQSWKDLQATIGKHPNIPHLLDSGTTEGGLHYLVMEDILGQPIDDYCNSRRLGVRERIELFAGVCEAVHFAHQRTVIHGALKPGNILLGSDGVPKLSDFGVASLIFPGALGDDLTKTAIPAGAIPTGPFVVESEFASPEQVKGEPLTTATDIYALGVVFYELLAGREPYQFKNRTLSEIFAAICEQVPERPSTAVSRHLVQVVPGPSLAESLPLPETDTPAIVHHSAAAIEPAQIALARGTTTTRLKRDLERRPGRHRSSGHA